MFLNEEVLANVVDAALDAAYNYGRSQPGTFGHAANVGTATAVLDLLKDGETNEEELANAAHLGWAAVALSYEDPIYLSKPQKRDARRYLARTPYYLLDEAEKEKDRVAARAVAAAFRSACC